MERMKRFAAGLAFVAFGGLLGWSLRGGPEPSGEDAPALGRGGAVTPRAEPTSGTGTFAECREKLVRREVELRAARATAARAVAGLP